MLAQKHAVVLTSFLIGELISHLLPLLMIRQQRIPRSRWILRENERGKKCIEKVRLLPSCSISFGFRLTLAGAVFGR